MSVDTDQWAVELAGLDREEIGVFIKLRLELWRRNAPLPDDDKAIAEAIGEDVRVVRRLRPRLAPLFIVADGNWRDDQVERAKAFATKRRARSVPPKNSPDLFSKPLKSAAPPACKEVREKSQEGDFSIARGARQAPAAPETEPAPSSKIREGEGRSRSRPRHSSWRRGTPLDPAWEPDQSGRAYAYERGHDDEWIERQVQRFRHYYRARRKTLCDWQEQWCLWVDDTAELTARSTFETRDERNKRANQKSAASVFRCYERYIGNANNREREVLHALR
jgi:hypothetical protein